jgi:hypothetical protein
MLPLMEKNTLLVEAAMIGLKGVHVDIRLEV